ncbi:DNA-binding protein [Pseudomonas sp. LFM046]|uniref:DNA-binding protein n=1 Tax=Pseudomonas sp. LFM046 TaxID=1608357 RepID=UPI0005CFAF07|nr:DNA-binding protein [Pseudomonas sp. LFM046]
MKRTVTQLLKKLTATDSGRPAAAPTLAEELTDLIGLLAERLRQDAEEAVAQEQEVLALERRNLQTRVHGAEGREQLLQARIENVTSELDAARQVLQLEHELRQQTETALARLEEIQLNQATLREEHERRIQALEGRNQTERDRLDHYLRSSLFLQSQDIRYQEGQVKDLQREIRQLREALSNKQDDLTRLNRDNERLVSEIYDLLAQQRLVEERSTSLEMMQAKLASAQTTQHEMELTNQRLVAEVQRLSNISRHLNCTSTGAGDASAQCHVQTQQDPES